MDVYGTNGGPRLYYLLANKNVKVDQVDLFIARDSFDQ